MTASLVRGVTVQVSHDERPGTDQAHVTLQYVQQLWQFVQAGAAQSPAERSEPLMVGQLPAIRCPGVEHRPELQDGERLAVELGTRRPAQYRPTESAGHQQDGH